VKRLRRLSSSSEEARIINEIIAELESLKLSAGPGVKLTGGPKGNVVSIDAKKQGRRAVDTWFVGDWNPNVSYVEGNGACIRGGLTAGLYMCHTDAPAGTPPPSPADDSYWTLLVSGNAMGNWI
jgi:hypothetical protein